MLSKIHQNTQVKLANDENTLVRTHELIFTYFIFSPFKTALFVVASSFVIEDAPLNTIKTKNGPPCMFCIVNKVEDD